jgi:hypothetical protein
LSNLDVAKVIIAEIDKNQSGLGSVDAEVLGVEVSPPKISTTAAGQVSAHVYAKNSDDVEISFALTPDGKGYGSAIEPAIATSLDSTGLVQHVLQVTNNSFRFVAESENLEVASKQSYLTTLPKSAYLVKMENGDYQILDEKGVYYGTLQKPWAVDAAGREFDTSLSLLNGELTQRSEINGEVAYPVRTDPSWSYSGDFALHIEDDGSTGIPPTIYYSLRSPAYVTTLLRGCFNCYFPVNGAPKTYPYIGQSMALFISNPTPPGMWRWEAPVKVSKLYSYGWEFVALDGHVDGAGSTIRFNWYSDSSKRLHLSVSATILNNNPVDFIGTDVNTDRSIYIGQAKATWQNFFQYGDLARS